MIPAGEDTPMLVKNANRTQNLMTKTVAKTLPPLYSQEEKGEAALAKVKFFHPMVAWWWYASEFDPETGRFFGLIISPQEPDGTLGYFSLQELAEILVRPGVAVERDRWFKPTPLSDCRKRA
jgi:hypothetical protein